MTTKAINAAVPPTSGHGQEPITERTRAGGLLGWMARAVPTTLVVATLGGVAYWGHKTEWNFVERYAPEKANAIPRPGGLAVVQIGAPSPEAAEAPAALRRRVTIAFDSAEVVEKAGIDIASAWTAAMTEAVPAGGELSFEPSRTARLSPRASGTAWWVAKAVGDPVKAGELLALIDATEVGKAKAEFQQALVQARLKQKAVANIRNSGGVVSERQQREAEAALRDAEVRVLSAEQALVNLGLPTRTGDYEKLSIEEVVQRMRLLGVPEIGTGRDSKGATANLLPVRSSFSGVVVTADVVAGEVAEAGKVLFVVVDPSRLWLTLHFGAEDAKRVAVGQAVKFRPDGMTDEFDGRVTWVGTSADETTRRVPVRAELANEAGLLRASTLGRGRAILREEPNAVVVPREAIQTYQGTRIVFVRDPDFLKADGQKTFHVRVVHTGAEDAQNTEILDGLKPNEVVATKASGLLLNELKRSLNGSDGSR